MEIPMSDEAFDVDRRLSDYRASEQARERPAAKLSANRDRSENIAEALTPLANLISQKGSYLLLIVSLAAFVFSLFLPWATIDSGLLAVDGGSSSGWNELGFLALVPVALPALFVIKKKPMNLIATIFLILLGFVLLSFDNVMNRSVWSSVNNPLDVSGSLLGSGFWIGGFALLALSFGVLSWSVHYYNDVNQSERENDRQA